MRKGPKMTNKAILNTESSRYKDIFFLHLAKLSGKVIRMDFSWCFGGYAAKIIPDKNNPYGWQIIFDAPERALTIEEGEGE